MLLLPVLMLMSLGAQGPQDVQAWRQHQDEKMRGERSPIAAERIVTLDKGRTNLGQRA